MLAAVDSGETRELKGETKWKTCRYAIEVRSDWYVAPCTDARQVAGKSAADSQVSRYAVTKDARTEEEQLMEE